MHNHFTQFSTDFFIRKAQDDRNYRVPETKRVKRYFHGPFQIQNPNCRWAQFGIDPCFKCVSCAREFYS